MKSENSSEETVDLPVRSDCTDSMSSAEMLSAVASFPMNRAARI